MTAGWVVVQMKGKEQEAGAGAGAWRQQRCHGNKASPLPAPLPSLSGGRESKQPSLNCLIISEIIHIAIKQWRIGMSVMFTQLSFNEVKYRESRRVNRDNLLFNVFTLYDCTVSI